MIKTTVNFVLLLQDDFTGEDLPDDGFRFWVDGHPARPLKKPEGLFVFTGIPGESWKLTVQGTHYSPRTVTIRKELLDPRSPMAVLRLFRRGDLRFGDCELLCGSHLPGAAVYALCRENPPLKLRLLEQDKEDGITRLHLTGYTPRPLARRRYCLGTGKNKELFVITKKDVDGTYICDQHFQNRHREGTLILRAYGTICDEQGRYAIPIEPGMKDQIQSIEAFDEEVKQWGCLSQTAPN